MHHIKLLPKQWEVFHPVDGVDLDLTLYQGGYGSGKTFLGAFKGLSVCAKNPGSTWLVVADTYARLKLSTVETYLELLDAGSIRHKWNSTDHTIRIPGWDNARVLFKGLDDPNALRSINGIGGHLEEVSELSEAAYLAFLGRLRQAGTNTVIEAIGTTNPQTTRGWLHEHFVVNAGIKTESVIRDGKRNDVTVSRRRVIAASHENKHLPNAYLAAMQSSYDEKLYNMMVLGQDGDYNAGLVCYNWSDAINVRETPYRPELRIYLTCDFNVDPMSWALCHRFNGEYHFFDELVLDNTTTTLAIEEFGRRYAGHNAGIILTGDTSGNNRSTKGRNALETDYTIMRNMLSSMGFRSVEIMLRQSASAVAKGLDTVVNPEIRHRVEAWNAAVCNSLGVQRVFADPKCKWLIWNCNNLRYHTGTSVIFEPTRDMIKKDEKLKYTKHIWDAASYLVEYFDPIKTIQTDSPRPRMYDKPFTPSRF